MSLQWKKLTGPPLHGGSYELMSRSRSMILCFLSLVAMSTGCTGPAATPSPTPTPTPTPPAVSVPEGGEKIALEVAQDIFYEIEIPEGPGFAAIIGELENTSDVAVVPPIIVEVWDSTGELLTPRDPAGTPLGDEFSATGVFVLPPGVKAPFLFPLGPSPFDDFTVAAWGKGAAPDELDNYHTELVVTAQRGTLEPLGQQSRYVIEGVVTNTGSTAAQEIRVIASCYNDQGVIVGMGQRAGLWRTIGSQDQLVEFLLPGEEADFRIAELITRDARVIVSCDLLVQGLRASPKDVATAQAEQDYVANIDEIIQDTLGESNRGVIRIIATGISSDGRIRITFAVDDAEDHQAILEKAKTDILDVMRALYTSGLLVSEVIMQGIFPIGDREEEVVTATLSAKTAQQLNWATMAPARLWEKLDDSWVHPTPLGQ